MIRRVYFCVAAWLLLGGAPAARAHELQPAYLELRQTGTDTYDVLWKVPLRARLAGGVEPLLPPAAKITSPIVHQQTSDADLERFTIALPGGLTGQTLGLTGPMAVLADALVRIVRPDGSAQFLRLNPATPTAVVQAAPNRWDMLGTFLRLGCDHVLTGVDHLLFVLGLLLIVPNRWMLVKTISAFTVAHSLTLAVATLGYASAPVPPLNAAIALSILFLGPEIVRARRGETSFTIQYPFVISFAFGLLHGFGFASGLTTLGLSGGEIPLALLGFNGGVEIGQLFFVAIMLLLARAFVVLEIHWTRWALALPAYTVGGLGAYWTIQRTWVMLEALR